MLRRYPLDAEPSADSTTSSSDSAKSADPHGDASGDGDDGEEGWISHNGLRVNADMRLCELDGQLLELTRSEFELLVTIMLGRRRVVSKNTLALEMRGDDAGVGAYVSESDRRAVEVHLANLRRKLNDSVSSPRFVETVRGVGYRLAMRQPDGAQRAG